MTAGNRKLRVFIATTRGPVAVVRIAAENPEVRSVVCVDGSLAALPVSGAYDAFVREPTGVVERYTGHPVYRSDVSGPIDSGESWQLGMFLAHLLKSAGLLAEGEEPAARDLLVTGRLDRALNVLPVDHVGEKLSRAGMAEEGLFLFPAAAVHPGNTGAWQPVPVSSAGDALEACLGREAGNALLRRSGHARQPFLPTSIPALATIAVSLASAIGALAYFLETRPSGIAPSMMRVEIVPRSPDGCGAPVMVPSGDKTFDGEVCSATASIGADGEYLVSMRIEGSFLSYVDPRRYERELHQFVRGGDELKAMIDFPYWVRQPMRLEIEAAQLTPDGAPHLTSRRSIEVRPMKGVE